jgi:hypothetical protein
MNENALRRVGISADEFQPPREQEGSHAFNRATSNQLNKK